MLHPVTWRTLALAACGCVLALDAGALTVGNAHGAVLVGRPLALTIPVGLEAADTDAPCAAADVFYGDQKVSRAPSVRFEAAGNRQGVLRVTSPLPVDEPMVTVYLRVGCGQSITRRYVLLSEVPPANEPGTAPAPAAVAPRAVPMVPAAVAGAAAAAPAGAAATAPPPAARRAAPAAAPAAPPPAAPKRVPRKEVAASEPAASSSRLTLDPIDLRVERDPTLRLTTELAPPAAAADPQARQAAAALWQALQRTPDEAIQQALRVQALQQELQGVRAATQKNAAEVGQMRAQVESARGERNQVMLLVAVLLAALAGVLAWLAWQWRRSHRLQEVDRWFEAPHDTAPAPAPVLAPPVAAAARTAAAPAATARTPAPKRAGAAPGTGERAVGPAAAEAIATATPSGWGTLPHAEFQPSQGGTVRMVGVQELIDVHDKADFFLALGQRDQAIAVLEAHVHDQVETSALAWMDLLEMYHSFGRRTDYDRLRSEFSDRFAVTVPDCDNFDQPTGSLENYGRALSRIVALWPSQRVMTVIEESIFRKPGLPGAEPFSLEAYRELVLLYNIAKEIAPTDDSLGMPLDYQPTDFPSTSLQPLNSLDAPERPRAPAVAATPAAPVPPPAAPAVARPAPAPAVAPAVAKVVLGDTGAPAGDARDLMIPPASPRIGLDIDLGAGDAPPAPGELPPLDFDISGFDAASTEDPSHKR